MVSRGAAKGGIFLQVFLKNTEPGDKSRHIIIPAVVKSAGDGYAGCGSPTTKPGRAAMKVSS
jgi:hypothetical protein